MPLVWNGMAQVKSSGKKVLRQGGLRELIKRNSGTEYYRNSEERLGQEIAVSVGSSKIAEVLLNITKEQR